ncbi:MAG: ABC transporter permease [Fibrobacter sp.]|nr:ABC transporter permease [Fibrobacter sp.]
MKDLVSYIAKRLVTILLSIMVIVSITYVLMYAAPGNFFDIQRFSTSAQSTALTFEQVKQLQDSFEEKYGLNEPLWKQIAMYLGRALQFKFGESFSMPTVKIETLIAQKFPVTFLLTIFSIAVAVLIGIPLGIIAALRRNTWIDYTAMTVSMVGQVIPSFVVGVVLVMVFCVYLNVLPTGGLSGPLNWIMPVMALSLGPMAGIARYTRSSLLEVLNHDYIRTAYAKGGTDGAVIAGHALKNSLTPIVTVLGPQIAYLLTGTVWIENMFRIPGLGQLFVNAAATRDYPLLVTSTFILALTVMLMNLIVDVVYSLLDPRIKLN